MAKLKYGRRKPYLVFSNDSDFFEAYGFLCNNIKHKLKFQWEYNANSGAWGNEGRIHFYKTNTGSYLPKPITLTNRLTAGRGDSLIHRLNCNDFIKELVNNYGFVVNPNKPGNAVNRSPQELIPPANPVAFVPSQYLNDYYRGYNM